MLDRDCTRLTARAGARRRGLSLGVALVFGATALLFYSPVRSAAQGYVTEEFAYPNPQFMLSGYDSDILVDASGNPSIAYATGNRNSNLNTLYYAEKSAGTWTISGTGVPGVRDMSAAFDPAGDTHFAFRAGAFPDFYLYYVKTVPAPVYFAQEFVDLSGITDDGCGIAVDADGDPRLCYAWRAAGGDNDLRLARKPGAVWIIDVVDGGADDVGEYSSIAIDSTGDSHIAYYDATNQNLKHAYKSGGSWVRETVDDLGGDAGRWTSIAVDPAGEVAISYLSTSSGRLKFARQAGGVWSREVVSDPSTSIDEGTSLAFDDAGRPHIAYYDAASNELRHAWRSATAWTIEMVDSSGAGAGVGLRPAIALDAVGDPHFSYYTESNEEPRYAFWSELTSVSGAVADDGAGATLVAFPNPCATGRVELRFALPDAGAAAGAWSASHAELAVYDAVGRRVRSLAIDALARAAGRAAWDGTADGGGRAAPGVYLLRLTSGGVARATQRVTLIR